MILNKMFLILLLPLVAAAATKEPKFMKGQKVSYTVPRFYSLVCTGKGKITQYDAYSDSYTVEEVLGNDDCPDISGLKEKYIQALK